MTQETARQREALKKMNGAAIYTTIGWVWPVDVRTDPTAADAALGR